MVMPTIVSESDCGCVVYKDCQMQTHIEYCKKHGGDREPKETTMTKLQKELKKPIEKKQEKKKLTDEVPTVCDKCKAQLEYKKSKTCTIDHDALRATCSCGALYEQNLNTGAVYVAPDGKRFLHRNCGEEIDCIWRTHPVWDGLFPCSGSGEVDRYPIPYCKKHEEEPSHTGFPVGEGGIH